MQAGCLLGMIQFSKWNSETVRQAARHWDEVDGSRGITFKAAAGEKTKSPVNAGWVVGRLLWSPKEQSENARQLRAPTGDAPMSHFWA